MINIFKQDNNKYYFAKANRYFKNDKWVHGKCINRLEKQIERKLKLRVNACSCNSGSDALMIALTIDRDPKRDIYITTPLSYIASSSIVKFLNLNIIYIDVNEENFLLDLNKLETFLKKCDKKILKRIKGIINVELFGFANDLHRLNLIANKYNLTLIGDCSQSFGTLFHKKSTLNYYDYSVVSFYPTKIFSAYGDGGMIFTKKKNNLKKARIIRNNGHEIINKNNCKYLGFNSRLDSFQALILLMKLKNFNNVIKKKKFFHDIFKNNIHKFKMPNFNSNLIQNNYLLSFYVEKKIVKKFINYMKVKNVECKIIYKKLLPENKILKPIISTNVKNAKKCTESLVVIPNHENISIKIFRNIIKLINEFKSK